MSFPDFNGSIASFIGKIKEMNRAKVFSAELSSRKRSAQGKRRNANYAFLVFFAKKEKNEKLSTIKLSAKRV